MGESACPPGPASRHRPWWTPASSTLCTEKRQLVLKAMEPARAHQHRARSASFEPCLFLLSWAAASVPPTRSSESQCWGRGFGHGQSLSRAALPVAWDQGAAHPCSAGQGVTPSCHTEPPGQGLGAKPQSRTSKAPVSTRPPVSDLRVILSPGYGAPRRAGPAAAAACGLVSARPARGLVPSPQRPAQPPGLSPSRAVSFLSPLSHCGQSPLQR